MKGNAVMGKGVEDMANYPNGKLYFRDIGNIHVMRERLSSLVNIILSTTVSEQEWPAALHNTKWLQHQLKVLSGAAEIARVIAERGNSVLVHCSDGWDRTSQLTSLSQLLLDPFYRTIKGFQILIEKEWLHFGHKFAERLGHPDHPKERSPVFLQFLESVYQIQDQFPRSFEYNRKMLAALVTHAYSGWFGTFLCNNQSQRKTMKLQDRTLSVWAFIDAQRVEFTNPLYEACDEVLMPICSLKRLRLWTEVYLKYDEAFLTRSTGSPNFRVNANYRDDAGASEGVGESYGAENSMIQGLDTLLAEGKSQVQGDRRVSALSKLTKAVTKQRNARDNVWMSDSAATSCLLCGAPFTFFRRRHHCRACGRLVCETCSEAKIVLKNSRFTKPVKVCDPCYDTEPKLLRQLSQ